MLLFVGLVLAVAAVAAAVGVVMANSAPTTLTVFGEAVPGVAHQWQVFLAGGAVATVFIVGMMVTFIGAGRTIRARRDLKEMRAKHEKSLTTLEMEKRQLQQELARVRRSQAAAPAPVPAPTPGRSAPAPGRPVASRPAPNAPARAATPRSQVKAASPFFDRAD
ncbi:hypothetical protein [Actinomadura kijaniata]|uniref:hypothetical protein n=1 Tax=Actinomadura kijaniata TaxID=46161 RepID=UPI00082CE441|nr:hypothetical protein [Actinomadura kijaniata]